MATKHFVPFILAVPLVAGALACSSNEPKEPNTASSANAPITPESSQAQLTSATSQTFTFAPPEGTSFVRTDKRNFESALVGTPLSRREEQELRWQVDISRSGEEYISKQQLVHVMMKHNGVTTVDSDVPKDAISAQLVIDRAGNLVDVRGLENSAAVLGPLIGARADTLEQNQLSTESLKRLVATRYDMMGGDIVGRPMTPNKSWTVAGRPGGLITSKTLVVEQMEPCGKASCARIREDIKLDPAAMTDVSDELVKRRVKQLGGNPSKVEAKTSMYSMTGSHKVEPATMLNHDASFSEKGRVIATAGKTDFEITLTGKMDSSYEYKTAGPTVGSR